MGVWSGKRARRRCGLSSGLVSLRRRRPHRSAGSCLVAGSGSPWASVRAWTQRPALRRPRPLGAGHAAAQPPLAGVCCFSTARGDCPRLRGARTAAALARQGLLSRALMLRLIQHAALMHAARAVRAQPHGSTAPSSHLADAMRALLATGKKLPVLRGAKGLVQWQAGTTGLLVSCARSVLGTLRLEPLSLIRGSFRPADGL